MPHERQAPECVLLAERHHGLNECVRGLLTKAFSSVFMVADQNSLMDGAERLQPTVAVIDLPLAGGDIAALLGSLQRRAPTMKILLLSVHDEPTVISTSLAAGADGVVLKRAIASDLLPAVEAALAGRRYVSPAIAH